MKFLPRWLRENFQVKLGLFILAILLWFLVVIERTYEYAFDIPIELEGVKKSRVVMNPVPDMARVIFQARGRELLQMQFFTNPYLRIDLSSINYYYTFRPRLDMIVLPGGLAAEPIEILKPDSIPVMLGELVELKLPVSPQVKAEPAAGYVVVGDYEVHPPEVDVVGPKQKIARAKRVKTVPAELDGLKRNTELQLALVLPYGYGTVVTPAQVKVLVRVERIGERKIKGVPLTVVNSPRGREVIVDPVSVDVEVNGGISVLSDLNAEDLEAWVDYQEYNPMSGAPIKVHVNLPESLELKRTSPANIRLIVRRR